MSTKAKPKMAPISHILDKKSGGEDEILYPTPTPFVWLGEKYKIKPMPNKLLKQLSGEFERVIELVARVATIHNANREEGQEDQPITPGAFLPYVPDVLEILLPNAVRIIAGSLRVDEERVADEMFLGKQVECLRLIIEANDFPLLMASFKGLTGMFSPPKATTAEMNTEADGEAAQD